MASFLAMAPWVDILIALLPIPIHTTHYKGDNGQGAGLRSSVANLTDERAPENFLNLPGICSEMRIVVVNGSLPSQHDHSLSSEGR